MVVLGRAASCGLLLGLALGVWACASDEVIFGEPARTGTGTAGAGGSAGGSPVGGGGAGTAGAGGGDESLLFVVPNLDDDDENGAADWADSPFPEDNELVPLTLPAEVVEGLEPSHGLRLTLSGEVDAFRFWQGSSLVLGASGDGTPIASADVGSDVVSSPLAVEARTFQRRIVVAIEHRDESDAIVASAELPVRAAPLVLNHHVQSAERIWAVVTGANGAMIDAIEAAAGERFSPIYSSDPWIQDELEWATATRDGHRLDVAVDSIRDRELDDWVKGLEAPDVQPMTWGEAGTGTTEDKFGNLEVAPPNVAAGVSYPFGRVYYGANDEVGPTTALTDMLAEQRIQAPVAVDTGWLCVGHVDEFLAFVPDSSSARGFKLLYADVDAAYTLLESMSAATSLPRYGSAHGYSTVGAILADASLRALNEDLQADYLDPIRATLLGELGIEAADVVAVPALFERVSGCPYSGAFMETTALIPALVNLTVFNPQGEAPVLFVPDPFLRPSGADQGTDPLVQAFRAAMPAGTEVVFVDDWYSYHLLMGDVHCGTNVSRTPSPRPWVEGLDLLGGA